MKPQPKGTRPCIAHQEQGHFPRSALVWGGDLEVSDVSSQGSLSPDTVPVLTLGDQGHMPPTAEQRGLDHAPLKDQQ